MTLEDVKLYAATHQRVLIPAKEIPPATTLSQKRQQRALIRRVIAEHLDVLMALKDR